MKLEGRPLNHRPNGLREESAEPESKHVGESEASPDNPDTGTPESLAVKKITIEDLRMAAEIGEGILLYHGGLGETATIDDIDLNRLGSQQNKRGRTYGGFYLTDESSKKWSTDYANSRGGVLHGFLVDKNARVLNADRIIDRLSEEERQAMSREYDLVKGKDALGRVQYVLLNKDVVTRIATEMTDYSD